MLTLHFLRAMFDAVIESFREAYRHTKLALTQGRDAYDQAKAEILAHRNEEEAQVPE
ncbi:MAG: hypothetical protein ACM3N4_11930 [Nitrososphaerota archaeon]